MFSKLGLLAGGCVILAIVAVTGWVRKPAPAAAAYYNNPAPATAYNNPAPATVAATPQPQAAGSPQQELDQYGQPAGAAAANSYAQGYDNSGANRYDAAGYGASAYNTSAYNTTGYGTGYVAQNGVCEATPAVLPAYADSHYVRTVHYNTYNTEAVAVPRTYTERYYVERGRVHHRRSLGKSIAIVAGSAGVGAGIGALAGGGRGAGIGALAGGAGGFIYDRLTHNH